MNIIGCEGTSYQLTSIFLDVKFKFHVEKYRFILIKSGLAVNIFFYAKYRCINIYYFMQEGAAILLSGSRQVRNLGILDCKHTPHSKFLDGKFLGGRCNIQFLRHACPWTGSRSNNT